MPAESVGIPPNDVALRLDMRLRYTNIVQSDKPERVDTMTVRVIPGFEVKLAKTLTLKAEVIHTDFLGSKRFNDDPAIFSPYPLLPDPRFSGLNQATLTWAPDAYFSLAAGRQAVKIGNERHVSDNNFRQVPQLFDGVMARWEPFDRSLLQVGYFPQERTVFGTMTQAKLGVLELAMNPVQDMSATLYAFRHQPEASLANLFQFGVTDYANATYGCTMDLTTTAGGVRLNLTAELARQRAIASGSPNVAANYMRVGVAATRGAWTLRTDHENRASNQGRYGFQTVLSDYYAFNGNSLVFYATPRDGLRDSWLTLRAEQGPWSMLHEYHWFRADVGGKDYGRELDLNFTYTMNQHWYARTQWAHYRPEKRPGVDVDKVWLTLGYHVH